MFYNAQFNGNVDSWNVANVSDMKEMFLGCPISAKWYKFKEEKSYCPKDNLVKEESSQIESPKTNGDSQILIETTPEKKLVNKGKQFDFKIFHDGFTENVAVYAESKWLAIAQMRKRYPGEKFEFIL